VDYILRFKEEVDKELELFFQRKLSGKSGIEREVISCLREFTLRGGKRIRPLFMLLGYWLNSDVDKNVIGASISLELMQSYLLIHDDIIDQSDLRRGGPSFHRLFKYDDRINEGIAIVSADLADAYSHEALLSSRFRPDYLNHAMKLMAETIEFTGVGQLMDVVLPLGEGMTLDDVTAIHRYKTAQYTVNGPMKIGAVLSGYPNVEKIDSYGISLGIAFQIQDDILGMFGDEKTLGKSVKSDFEEGKKTHLILYAYELASQSEREFIKRNLGRKDISDEDFERAREIIESSGALEKTRELSEKYYKLAVSSIDDLTEDREKRDELLKMAEKMVRRIS
jgi:geranylgeranyl diphosphate synthase type I